MQVRDTAPGNGAGPRGSGDVGASATSSTPPSHRPDPPPPPPGFRTTGDYPRLGGDSGLRLEPPTATPRRRLPELVLGIFLVAGCALAAVLLAAAGRERTPALALTGGVERGHVIEADDLHTIYIGSDSAVAYVSPDDEADIVGRAALSNLPEGALITPDQFADPAALPDVGEAEIGVTLDAAAMPSLELAPGDRVTVVTGSGGAGGEQVDADPLPATVQSVRKVPDASGQQERWWVSLRMSESDAIQVAAAKTANAGIELLIVGSQ